MSKMDKTAGNDSDNESNSIASSSTGSDHDDDWNDWVDNDRQGLATRSLFEDSVLDNPQLALQFDKDTHGFDLVAFCAQLGLDTHQRIRLINYIRSQKAQPDAIKGLQGTEPLFSDDTYLKPVIEDDPLLQLQADEWSESEDEYQETPNKPKTSNKPLDQASQLRNAGRDVRNLRERLAAAQQDLDDYRSLVNTKIAEIAARELGSDTIKEIREEPAPADVDHDDDTHYFESYAEHNIHWVMLTDKVRTSTYATFIVSNPSLFRDAVVMDVGCGTGILSLFAARAGAKKVFAVEASKIADKAEAIFKASGYGDVVTLVRGKVESISLPEEYPKVDIIISEWMGYALLYESMLDSVLVARDRFLKPLRSMGEPSCGLDEAVQRPSGVMAPSQCRMILSLGDPKAIIKQRIGFWNNVYGFDMSVMAAGVHDEAIVDYVSKNEILSTQCIVKDLNLQTISSSSLSFSSPFQLKVADDLPTSPAAKAAKIKSGQTYFAGKLHEHRTYATAFILWFETFFHPEGMQYGPNDACKVHGGEGEWETGDVLKLRPSLKRKKTSELGVSKTNVEEKKNDDALASTPAPAPAPTATQAEIAQSPTTTTNIDLEKGREESFTTGPQGAETHWKQTIFLLKSPIELNRGTEVKGTFHCRKNTENTRELDVEFHYTVHAAGEGTAVGSSQAANISSPIIQCFRVS